MKKLIVIFLLIPGLLYGIRVGSNSTVNRYDTIQYFPTLDSDNEIIGFARLTKGFVLEDQNTTCTFDGLFPVSGNIFLNQGVLYLDRDIVFNNSFELYNSGKIAANFNSITFPYKSNIFRLPKVNSILKNITGYDVGDVLQSVDWSYDDKYIAMVHLEHVPGELQLFSFDGSILTYYVHRNWWDDAYSIRWHPNGYIFAVAGTDYYSPHINYAVPTGEAIPYGGPYPGGWFVTYNVTDPGQLSVTSLNISPPRAFITTANEDRRLGRAVAWHPTGGYLACGTSNGASYPEIMIYSMDSMGRFTSLNPSASAELPSGIGVSRDAMDWDPTGKYLVVGADKIYVYYFDGSSLNLKDFIDEGYTVNCVDWSNTTSLIASGISSSSDSLNIYSFDYTTENLSKVASASEDIAVLGCHWVNSDHYLAVGRKAAASDTELHVYYYDIANNLLVLTSVVNALSDVDALRWSHSGDYLVIGGYLSTYMEIFEFLKYSSFIFENAKIKFNSDTQFSNTCYFKGNCEMEGNNNILDLSTTGSIIVKENSSLLLKNITIKNISNNNFSVLDNSGTFSFDNAKLSLNEDYEFNRGRICILGDLYISGGHAFAYKSDQVSEILSYASLYLDYGVTFSYSPSINSKILFNLKDQTSRLCLNGGRLFTSSTGWNLTKGSLILKRKSYLFSEGLEGFTFGDSISPANNLCIIGDQNMVLTEGCIVNYKNID